MGAAPIGGPGEQQRGHRLSCAVNEHSTVGARLSSAGPTGNLSVHTALPDIHIKNPQALFNSPWKGVDKGYKIMRKCSVEQAPRSHNLFVKTDKRI